MDTPDDPIRLSLSASGHPIGVLYQFWPNADGTGRMVFISKGADAFLESTADEIGWMLERRCLPLFGVDEDAFYKSIEHAIWQRIPWASQLGYTTPRTGRRLWLHLQSYPQTAADGRLYFSGHWLDLTPLKNAEEESRFAYRVLSTHLENTPLAVIEWDSDFRIERWSGQAEAIFGWTAEEVLGKRSQEWPLVHPEDAGRVAEVIRKLRTQAEPRNVSTNRNLHKSGRVLHCVWHNSVVVDGEGRLVSILSLVEDQTAKVELDRQLLEAHRLESVGFLAGGIAHDFNNLITIIMGHAGIARELVGEGSPIEPSLNVIDDACARATQLCEQITAVAGIGRLSGIPLNLNDVIQGAESHLASLLGNGTRLRLELAMGLPPILGEMRQLQQVLESIVVNAYESLAAEGGEVVVSTSGLPIYDLEATRGFFPSPMPGEYVLLSVRDNGRGIAEEIRGKIFEPFFSTKRLGRGLGLATVRGIMHGHQGCVKITSKVDEGTTVELLFPVPAG
jgi:PAS domain S-box-containing protein